mgnify:CR=1 FL=1
MMFRQTKSILIPILITLALSVTIQAGEALNYPPTDKTPATDIYHGIPVTEDYRWLEDASTVEVKNWTDAQNALTRSLIDASSNLAPINTELKRLYTKQSSTYSSLIGRQGILFAMKNQPPKHQSFLVTLGSVMDTTTTRVIVDPNVLDTAGYTSINWYVPSLDGKKVAVCMSRFGSELGDVYVFDVATGKQLSDTVTRVNGPTAGGGLAWNADGTGFYYTRYPHSGERPDADLAFYQQVFFHPLGTPCIHDKYEIGQEFPRIAEVELESSNDGKFVLATVSNGDGGEYAHYLAGHDGKWEQLTKFSDRITQAEFGLDNSLYLLSLNGAPHGQVLRLPLDGKPELSHTTVFVTQGEGVITGFEATAQKLYVSEMFGGPSRIRVFSADGKEATPLPTEPVITVGSMLWTTGDKLLFSQLSYLSPGGAYIYDPADNSVTETALKRTTTADVSNIEVVRESAVSKDGTHIPINILKRKGTKLDGSNPTILYGYGGYGISMTPHFSARNSIWINAGGIYAIANIRGGGEFGDEWHLMGNLTKKQNVFDDFIACAERLIKTGYTSPAKLGIEGGSNGGLLMGATLIQRPDLFRAVVSSVGIYDMLRVELHPNGEYNTTEFGTVKDKAQFEALYAYSPYHHVVDGTPYPAVLFVTGEHDGRVDPYNSRKMTARMQVATSSDRPILLRLSSTAGHGQGTRFSEGIDRDTDVLTFWFDQLGLTMAAPPD